MFADGKDLNTLQIIDFGLASHINDKKRRLQCGTPGYMAPEIMKSDDECIF